jgi:hypothetical protein
MDVAGKGGIRLMDWFLRAGKYSSLSAAGCGVSFSGGTLWMGDVMRTTSWGVALEPLPHAAVSHP